MGRLAHASRRPVRLLALLEAEHVTGPVKNLLAFARDACGARGATGAGLELGVATFRRAGRSLKALWEALDDAGIEHRCIEERRRYDTRVFAQVRQTAQEWQADLLQTHAVKSHFVLRASGLYRVRPWIAFHHGYTLTDLKMRLYNQCDRWSLRRAHALVAVSRSTTRQLARLGFSSDAVRIVPNEPDRRPPPLGEAPLAVRRSLGAPDDAALILGVGRLSPEKGFDVLLEAMAATGRNGAPPWNGARLVLAGEGPERAALERRIRRLGLDGRAILLGHRADVPDLLAAADLFVLPSLSEGSPNALLEALQAGVPVVASDIEGIRDLAENGQQAVLVPAGDPQALGQAVATLLADRESRERLASRGRERLQATPADRTAQLLELYAGLTASAVVEPAWEPRRAAAG